MAKLFIIGYGTLLYRESLANTIGGSAGKKEYIPVIIKGFKRIFNLLPEHYSPSFKISKLPVEKAAANVIPTGSGYLNGLAFEVAENELSELDRREKHYRRVECNAADFHSGVVIERAMIYSAPYGMEWVTRDPKYLPDWEDIAFARTGAYRYGSEFGRMYDQTTFLADGTTLMAEYYKDHLDELNLDKTK